MEVREENNIHESLFNTTLPFTHSQKDMHYISNKEDGKSSLGESKY